MNHSPFTKGRLDATQIEGDGDNGREVIQGETREPESVNGDPDNL